MNMRVEDQVDARVGDRHRQPGGHLPVDDAPVDRIEPSALIFHLGEGLDDPDANDVLPYHLHHAVDALLQLGVEGNALAGDGDDDHRQKRQRGEQQPGQHRFQREGDGDAPQQHDRRPDTHALDHIDHAVDVVGVRGHPGDQ